MPAAGILAIGQMAMISLFAADVRASETILDIMTFNVRWDGLDTGRNAWVSRKPLVIDVFKTFAPDVCGLQEPSYEQTRDLDDALEEFASFAGDHPRDETIPILYKSARFKLLNSGSFWLVEASELSGGTRRCNWVRLQDKTSKQSFYVYNCHLDHRAPESRLKSAEVLVRTIASREHDDPFLITGDFNEREQGKAMRFLAGERAATFQPLLLLDTFRALHPPGENQGTGHGFKGVRNRGRIDYVWAGEGVKLLQSQVIYYNRDGFYPSDHFPVLTRVKIQEP